MADLLEVRGEGNANCNGTVHVLHWNASVTASGLVSYLKTGACPAIELAKWCFKDGTPIEGSKLAQELALDGGRVEDSQVLVRAISGEWTQASQWLELQTDPEGS